MERRKGLKKEGRKENNNGGGGGGGEEEKLMGKMGEITKGEKRESHWGRWGGFMQFGQNLCSW